MSRRNPSLSDILVHAPWWVSAAMGVAAWIALRGIVPATATDNAILKAFATQAPLFSWIALFIFGALAFASATLSHQKRLLLDQQRGVEGLRGLSWKRFEWLVGEAYRRRGYAVEESLADGADGGIDLILRKDGQTILVQCKQWKRRSVGAPIVREMYGLLTHHRADGIIVAISGNFTRDARSFAEGKPIQLINGPALSSLIRSVQRDPGAGGPAEPEGLATSPPASPPAAARSDVPPCPKCGSEMKRRTARSGPHAGQDFWGCTQFPRCRGTRTLEGAGNGVGL